MSSTLDIVVIGTLFFFDREALFVNALSINTFASIIVPFNPPHQAVTYNFEKRRCFNNLNNNSIKKYTLMFRKKITILLETIDV